MSGSRTARGSYPETSTSLYLLKRARRTDGSGVGDVILADQICALAALIPQFGDQADQRLTSMNCLAYSPEFWLDKYFEKELFYTLHLLT